MNPTERERLILLAAILTMLAECGEANEGTIYAACTSRVDMQGCANVTGWLVDQEMVHRDDVLRITDRGRALAAQLEAALHGGASPTPATRRGVH